MKFIGILLNEGRKEDLKKKYSTKFNEQDLEFILNISDLKDFNHKYTDFVLKNTDGDGELDTDELEHLVGLIKDFDKYSGQFPKKDINQYMSLNELESVVNFVRTKNKDKELEGQAKKIYEKGDFVVIQPKTEQASCKYGSNTKWCVTSKDSGHFGRYTAGRQGLYFIINKAKSTNANYSKVAIHFDDGGNIKYWDSQDSPMTQREIDVFEYAFPEMIDSIKDDYNSQIQFEKTQQTLIKSSNTLLATSIKSLKKTIEQFNTQIEEAIQKSLLESIKRTSIVAQNRGFSKEISALLKHVNTLNLLIQTINVQIATIETKTKIEGEAQAFAAEKNGIVLNSILVVYWDGFTSDVTQPKFYGWGYNDDRRMDWGNSHGRLYFKNFDKESVKVNLSATFNKTKNTPNVNGFINQGPKWFEFGETPGNVNTFNKNASGFPIPGLTTTIPPDTEKTIFMKFNPEASGPWDSQGPNGFWGAISNTTTYYGWMQISSIRADGFVDTIPYLDTQFALTKWHKKSKTYTNSGGHKTSL